MIAWPQTVGTREIADPEPVEAPISSGDRGSAAPPPAIEPDASSAPVEDAAPALSAPPSPTTPLRAPARPAGLLLAFGFSAAVHAAALAYLGENTARPGTEAAVDAVSVEIVFDAPPSRPVVGAAASQSAAAPEPRENAPAENEAPEETEARQEKPEPVPTPDALELPADRRASEIPPPAQALPPTEPAMPQSLQGEEAQTAEVPPDMNTDVEPKATEAPPETLAPAEPADELLDAPEAVATVVLPREDVPVPSPRPEPAAAPNRQPSRKAAARQPEKPRAEASARPAAKKAGPARHAASAPAAAGRQGGATAGEKQAYVRKLLGHVERHKRYPREAQREGIAGSAGLRITIDRQGRLADARLSKSSGHAVLDEEALAVARRAAPYPSPPAGIGGSTVTFTVTLRFSR